MSLWRRPLRRQTRQGVEGGVARPAPGGADPYVSHGSVAVDDDRDVAVVEVVVPFRGGVTLDLVAMERERRRVRRSQGLPEDDPPDFRTADGFTYF